MSNPMIVYFKAKQVIRSCENNKQLAVALEYARLAVKKYPFMYHSLQEEMYNKCVERTFVDGSYFYSKEGGRKNGST